MSTYITHYTKSAMVIALLLLISFSFLTSCTQNSLSTHVYTTDNDSFEAKQDWQASEELNANQLSVGAQRYSRYLPLLEGKRVSLVVNQSSLVRSALVRDNDLLASSPISASEIGHAEAESSSSLTAHSRPIQENQPYQHLVDALLQRNVNLVSIMSPEHGFRGDKGAGEKVNSDIDAKTGLPIHSLYGATKKPTSDMLENTDVIIFDIQDVGVRFYTYLSTLHYVMEAAFVQGIQVVVLDRPNPNGRYVDGPVLKPEFSSFIGMHPIPVLHGMTLGELAQMILGEGWLDVDEVSYKNAKLTVIPIKDYKRTAQYSLPVAPSPNLPNDLSIQLYPTLCFFEGTDVSIGRGTHFPFQLIGHPDVVFGESQIPVKANSAAPHPKHEDTVLNAHVFTYADPNSFESFSPKPANQEYSPMNGLDIDTLIDTYSRFFEYNKMVSASDGFEETFFTRPVFFDKLAGTDALRIQIETGKTPAEIRQSWHKDLKKFREKRKAYLLYEDTD